MSHFGPRLRPVLSSGSGTGFVGGHREYLDRGIRSGAESDSLPCVVQDFFSPFPGGLPAVGLFLLRGGVATALFVQGAACLADRRSTWSVPVVGLMAAVCGVLVLIGLLTAVAAFLAALGTAAVSLSWLPSATANAFEPGLTPLLVVLVATAIAFLGPGAFSLDAALFGRREIVIPQARSEE